MFPRRKTPRRSDLSTHMTQCRAPGRWTNRHWDAVSPVSRSGDVLVCYVTFSWMIQVLLVERRRSRPSHCHSEEAKPSPPCHSEEAQPSLHCHSEEAQPSLHCHSEEAQPSLHCHSEEAQPTRNLGGGMQTIPLPQSSQPSAPRFPAPPTQILRGAPLAHHSG